MFCYWVVFVLYVLFGEVRGDATTSVCIKNIELRHMVYEYCTGRVET